MSFELKTEQFSGPLQVLLDLITDQKLPITEVSLSEVAEAYLKYMEKEEVAPEELADFLLIATKLLYLKSKTILPDIEHEEEEDPSNLVDQLKMYEKFVRASEVMNTLYDSPQRLFGRAKQPIKKETGFFPPTTIQPESLKESFQHLLRRLEPWARLRRASVEKVISVQERIAHLRQAILSRSKARFQDIVKGANKVDVVVSFLALLELLRERTVHVTQKDQLSDIIIKHVD